MTSQAGRTWTFATGVRRSQCRSSSDPATLRQPARCRQRAPSPPARIGKDLMQGRHGPLAQRGAVGSPSSSCTRAAASGYRWRNTGSASAHAAQHAAGDTRSAAKRPRPPRLGGKKTTWRAAAQSSLLGRRAGLQLRPRPRRRDHERMSAGGTLQSR